MNLLDDEIDDLLRAFRADEAVLGDDARTRMWARICTEVPDAPTALDALDDAPTPGVRRLRARRPRPRARVLGIAAAILVLLAVAAVAVRSGPDDRSVTAGPTPTEVPVPSLQELADQVAAQPVPALGSSPATRYTHLVLDRVNGGGDADLQMLAVERWIDIDGLARIRSTSGLGSQQDLRYGASDPRTLGLFAPRRAVSLPDDADAVVAAIDEQRGVPTVGSDVAERLVETLAYAGLPAPARAGILRTLDRFGFVPMTTAAVGPMVVRVEGPGPDGSTLQADLDLRTGRVVGWTSTTTDGVQDATTVVVADLRADTEGP